MERVLCRSGVPLKNEGKGPPIHLLLAGDATAHGPKMRAYAERCGLLAGRVWEKEYLHLLRTFYKKSISAVNLIDTRYVSSL